MDRVTLYTHQGKRMLHLDLTGMKPPEYPALAEHAGRIITAATPGSQLIVTTVTDARFDNATTALMGRLIKDSNPYIKGNAIVGAKGLQRVAVIALRPIWKTPINEFPDFTSASDWLASLSP